MATTIVYNVDSLNDEMLKYTDSIPLFVETKLHFIFKPLQLQEHRNIIISKDLIKQISLLTMEANKRKYHNINNVFDIDKKISYDNNSQWIIDALNKYIIKTVDDLLKIVELEKDLSKKNPVTPIVPKKKKGNRKNSDSSEEYKSIRGSNSSSYSNGDQKDSNNSMSLFKPEHTIVESEEDYSSYLPADYNASYELTPTSITKSPKPIDAAGYLPFDDENVAATLYNKTVPVRHNEFYSASRRLGEAGLPVRLRKSFVNEFMILFSRSLRYHFNNVSGTDTGTNVVTYQLLDYIHRLLLVVLDN